MMPAGNNLFFINTSLTQNELYGPGKFPPKYNLRLK